MIPERIPGIFPISPKWRFILFGLGTIQYAKHPEGVIEMTRAKQQEKRAKKAERRAAQAAAAERSAAAVERADVEEPVS